MRLSRHTASSTRVAAVVDGADCVDDDSCSVEELQALLEEVKSKAAEIKELEAKLTALNKDDSSTLKQMLAAEEHAASVLFIWSSGTPNAQARVQV